MIRKHRNIVIALLLANFLFANVGLGVNWMYCYCKGTTEFSLFSIKSSCGKEDTVAKSCCKSNNSESGYGKAACCNKFEKYRTAHKPCTKKGKKYLKADLKIYLKGESVQKDNQKTVDHFFVADFLATASLFVAFLPQFNLPRTTDPPADSGREILLKIQNFRC